MANSSAKLRLYIAASLDGFVSTADGKVAWLDRFNTIDYGYEPFIKEIGTVVYGRATFDQVLTFGPWTDGGRKTIVLTHRPLGPDAPEGIETYAGDIDQLITRLRQFTTGDVWLIGGGQSIVPFLRRQAVDILEVFLMPVLLGAGIRLFPAAFNEQSLRLIETKSFPNGVVYVRYQRA